MSLPSTENFKVFVSAFDTPDHIFVQVINRDGLKLEELNRDLFATYGSMQKTEGQLTEGMVVVILRKFFEI